MFPILLLSRHGVNRILRKCIPEAITIKLFKCGCLKWNCNDRLRVLYGPTNPKPPLLENSTTTSRARCNSVGPGRKSENGIWVCKEKGIFENCSIILGLPRFFADLLLLPNHCYFSFFLKAWNFSIFLFGKFSWILGKPNFKFPRVPLPSVVTTNHFMQTHYLSFVGSKLFVLVLEAEE